MCHQCKIDNFNFSPCVIFILCILFSLFHFIVPVNSSEFDIRPDTILNEKDAFIRIGPPWEHCAAKTLQGKSIIQTAKITAIFQEGEKYDDFPDEAKKAVEYALSIWGYLLKSDVEIEILFGFNSLGPGCLASGFPKGDIIPESGEHSSYIPPALMNAKIGYDVIPDQEDGSIIINSDLMDMFYFGLDGNTPSQKIDFVSLVLHEITHILGFLSFAYSGYDGKGTYGLEIEKNSWEAIPSIYTTMLIDGQGNLLISPQHYQNDSIKLGEAYRSNAIFWSGEYAQQFNDELLPKMYAPSTFIPGSSLSHLDESFYDGTINALMTPALNTAEAIHTPGPITLGILQDLGWTVNLNSDPVSPSTFTNWELFH
jgi:hypothetical protein